MSSSNSNEENKDNEPTVNEIASGPTISNHDSSCLENMDKEFSDQNIYINPADGLPSELPTETEDEKLTVDQLPKSVIVTNIPSKVFKSPSLKSEMEELFGLFCDNTTFQWLSSFKRLRVDYDNWLSAATARVRMDKYNFHNTLISCYLAQVIPISDLTLKPPTPTKQFLISPPSSPPAGWKPRDECEPLVNHELLAALATLNPGESCELIPPTDGYPGIIVHTAKKPDSSDNEPSTEPAVKIVPTKLPKRT